MKSKLLDSISPKFAWFPIGIILIYDVSALVLCFLTNPLSSHLIPFYCSIIIIWIILFTASKKLRRVDFTGKEVILKDIHNHETTIDALLFKEVTSFFWFAYSIRFTDGRYFLFIINPVTELFESVTLNKVRVYYEIEVTNELYEIIEKEYPGKNIDAPSITESKSKAYLWAFVVMILIYYSVIPPFFSYLEHNDVSTIDEIRSEEFNGVVLKKYRIEYEHDSPVLEIKSRNDSESKVYLNHYYPEVFELVDVGDTISAKTGDTVVYIRRKDTSFTVRRVPTY